ncbi:ABC transporter permease [Lipingzhangella sp. LS1_29]|uniref:ABC transporter permease n=1 Tax=Lipingzhangella rawalii TaxID=2055835 RepID=A0ABU2HAT4_9ACTN|nr:ABC transporter permease [Lipingzhangella rawalii]MDS1272391.1 ABC transporter permease [Lipingzhangella rawalii]
MSPQPGAPTPHLVLRRARRWGAWVPLALPGLLAIALAVGGPLVVAGDPPTSLGQPFQPPGPDLPLGTDHRGRDVWAVVCGAGTGLILLPLLATALSTGIGTTLGMLAGWHGGRVEALALRAAELVLVIPPLLVTLLVLHAAGDASAVVLVALITVLGTPATTRFTWAATTAVVARGYVEHAAALGERTTVLLCREVLPTIAAPVLADAGLRLVGAVYLTASIGFLGLGGPVLGENWGAMVAENLVGASLNPWAALVPAACIVAFATSVNLVADRLADRFRRSW